MEHMVNTCLAGCRYVGATQWEEEEGFVLKIVGRGLDQA